MGTGTDRADGEGTALGVAQTAQKFPNARDFVIRKAVRFLRRPLLECGGRLARMQLWSLARQEVIGWQDAGRLVVMHPLVT